MAMFGASPRESYDALYGVLNQPADTTALEREQAPGFFAGDMSGALGTGVYRGLSRGAATAANVATPAMRPIAKSFDELFGTSTDEWLLGEQDKANRALTESKLDPKTSGMAAQVLYGLGDVLTTVGSTGGNPYAAGGLYGLTQAKVGMSEGLDTTTAVGKGFLEGLGLGVGVALAPAYGSTLIQKMLSGAGINAAVGIGTRTPVSILLNARGYPEMAKQYAPLDATSVATDVVLGLAFGGLYKPPAKPLPPPKPEGAAAGVNVSMNPVVGFFSPNQILQFTEDRLALLIRKRDGTQDQTITGPDGKPMIIRGELPNFLTPEEKAEIAFLEKNKGNVDRLAKGYQLGISPEILPSAVDAALTANQATHAEIHTAPGVPTDTRSRQAHAAALDSAVESLVMGRDVSVEALLKDAGFLGKRPDFDAMRVIADELEKAGAGDVLAKLREVEAEARGRGLYVEPDTLGSVVLSEKPVESSVAGTAGRESQVRIGDEYVPTRLTLVEAGDIAATMTKADNQFRDRTRLASEQQIQDIASRLDAHLLMDAPVMDYGAPVLAADGTVIGGNGRAAAIGLAYERGTAGAYREALRAEFGDAVDGMQRPMLVRVLQRDVDVAKAAILSNEGQALRMSALEQAKVDAERLGDFRAFEFGEDGGVDLVANMPFIRAWAEQMPPGQRAAIMDADGKLSAEGAGRLRNAILYRAYGDSPTLARLVEATDPGSRNIATALTRAAPAVADAREAIARGDLYPMGLHDDLVSAVEKMDALRRSGMGVGDWVKQLDAFGDGMTAEARLLVQFMDQNIRASRAVSDGVLGYYRLLTDAGNPKQGSMFEAAQPDKGRMLALALDGDAPMYSRSQIDTPEFKAWFGGSKVVDADGKPLVVYHGTNADFTEFKTTRGGEFGPAIYMTDNPREAGEYGEAVKGVSFASPTPSIMPVYVRILNPYTQGVDAFWQEFGGADSDAAGVERAKAAGHDGVIAQRPDRYYDNEAREFVDRGEMLTHYIAFDPTQIKSATGNRGTFDPTNPDIRMSRGVGAGTTAANLVTSLRAMFGKDADRLLETGRVKVVQSVKNLPGSGHPSDVGGMFWKGEAYVVADNTGMAQIRGRVLHEVGEHAGMEQMLGADLYAETLRRIEAKVGTDPVFKEARALAEARANRPEHVPAETLAYLVENAPELPVVRRVLAQVRQWLYRVTGGRFVDLTQADLQMMAVASLRRYAREAEVADRGDAPWYMTLFHGTPNPFKPEPGAPLGSLRWKYINTGEGAQAFGYGHYIAQQEWIARTRYRDRLVERRADTASMTIERPGQEPFTFTANDGPAYRVGDRVVHLDMGGEEAGIAWVIREIKSGSPAEMVRTWAKGDLDSAKSDLGNAQRALEAEKRRPPEDRANSFIKMNEERIAQKTEEVARYEAALRAVDELTVPDPDPNFPLTTDKLRKLRDDIIEVRPEPPKGALYGKHIPDDVWEQMMIWDAPLSKQPENVREAFRKIGIDPGKKLEWEQGSSSDWFTLNDEIRIEKRKDGFHLFVDGKDKGGYISLREAQKAAEGGATISGESAYRRFVTEINARDEPHKALVNDALDELAARRGFSWDDFKDRPPPDWNSEELASIILHNLGVPGHRFLDGETRARGWDDPNAKFNVVLFSDDLGRVAWEARNNDTEWVTANGKGRVVMAGAGEYAVEVDGQSLGMARSIEEATRMAERELDGQLYSRTSDGDIIEDTTLPGARAMSDQADVEIAQANELSQGFLPAVECFLRVGE